MIFWCTLCQTQWQTPVCCRSLIKCYRQKLIQTYSHHSETCVYIYICLPHLRGPTFSSVIWPYIYIDKRLTVHLLCLLRQRLVFTCPKIIPAPFMAPMDSISRKSPKAYHKPCWIVSLVPSVSWSFLGYIVILPSRKWTVGPCQIGVGRWISNKHWLCSGSVFIYQKVCYKLIHSYDHVS
jgi:hypothetical protein